MKMSQKEFQGFVKFYSTRLVVNETNPWISADPDFLNSLKGISINLNRFNLPDIDTVLNHKYNKWDLGHCTIRNYLVSLARKCWVKEDSFNGKKPFGNSGWKYDVYNALGHGGFIRVNLDNEGNIYSTDEEAGDLIIKACFDKLANG